MAEIQYENCLKVNNTLYVRTYNPDTNTSSLDPVKYIPRLWIAGEEENNKKSFINQQSLKELNFKNMNEYRDTVKLYEDTDVRLFGHDSLPFGYLRENFPDPTASDHDFHTMFVDIEVGNGNVYDELKKELVEVTMTPENEAKARALGII